MALMIHIYVVIHVWTKDFGPPWRDCYMVFSSSKMALMTSIHNFDVIQVGARDFEFRISGLSGLGGRAK